MFCNALPGKNSLNLRYTFQNLISADRHSPVIFSSDWSFIIIFAIFNIIGGYLSNASFMLGPKMVNLTGQGSNDSRDCFQFETLSNFSYFVKKYIFVAG